MLLLDPTIATKDADFKFEFNISNHCAVIQFTTTTSSWQRCKSGHFEFNRPQNGYFHWKPIVQNISIISLLVQFRIYLIQIKFHLFLSIACIFLCKIYFTLKLHIFHAQSEQVLERKNNNEVVKSLASMCCKEVKIQERKDSRDKSTRSTVLKVTLNEL